MPSSTADHVLLRLVDLADDPPVFLTVRTRTREGAISADSNVVRVPRAGAATQCANNDMAGNVQQQQQKLLSSSMPAHILGNKFFLILKFSDKMWQLFGVVRQFFEAIEI